MDKETYTAEVVIPAPAVLCERCGIGRYTPYDRPWQEGLPPRPAMSRVADLDICEDCGMAEAIREATGAGNLGPDEWPVTAEPFRVVADEIRPAGAYQRPEHPEETPT